jgi:hypothetical protein
MRTSARARAEALLSLRAEHKKNRRSLDRVAAPKIKYVDVCVDVLYVYVYVYVCVLYVNVC